MAATFSVTEKDYQSWATWGVHRAMKAIGMELLVYGPRFLRSDVAKAEQPEGSPELTIPTSRLRGASAQHRLVNNFHVYDITPATLQQTGTKRKLIYFAGGGFQSVASGGHWAFCAEIVNTIPNTTAVLVSYPLSPTNVCSNVYPMIQQTYLALLAEAAEQGAQAIVGGDSAGGNLSLGLPLSTLKADPKALYPATILAISPAVEATHDNPDIPKIEPYDPMLTKAYCLDASGKWRGAWPTTDPRLSPLYADLSVFKERNIHVVGVVGKYDVLAPDDLLFVEKSRKAGISCEWLLWNKQMHCFPLAFTFGLPEAVEALNWIVRKLQR